MLIRNDGSTSSSTEQIVFDDSPTVETGTRFSSHIPSDGDPVDSSETATNALAVPNPYVRLSEGDIPRISVEQLEGYLTQNRRSVEALLGALRASGDDALLAEAQERFPDDPRVQFAAAYKAGSPEERQRWLEKFKVSDPGNALPDYLLAAEHFKSGQRLPPRVPSRRLRTIC